MSFWEPEESTGNAILRAFRNELGLSYSHRPEDFAEWRHANSARSS
jgi:hypothetical protein